MVERFVDALVPSEADELAARRRRGVAAPRAGARSRPCRGAAASSAGCCCSAARADEALELLEAAPGDFVADGLAARARLAGDPELEPAFEAWDAGDHAAALEALQAALRDPERRDLVRRVMVAMFTELGPDDPLAREHRRRLAPR